MSHAYRQVTGIPVRDVCGICGQGPEVHEEAPGLHPITAEEWNEAKRDGAERGSAPIPPIFVDGQVLNHAAVLNDLFGRLYRVEAKLDALIAALKARGSL